MGAESGAMKSKLGKILASSIKNLRGIGEVNQRYLQKLLGGDSISHLLLLEPKRIESALTIDQSSSPLENTSKLNCAIEGSLVALKLKIISHLEPKNPSAPYKIIGEIVGELIPRNVTLSFFRIFPSQLAKMLIGKKIAVTGTIKYNKSGQIELIHPQEILPEELFHQLPKEKIIYPLSGELTHKFVRNKVLEAINLIKQEFDEAIENKEWINQTLLKQNNWPSFLEAILILQRVKKATSEQLSLAKRRLAYDELLAWQFALYLFKNRTPKKKIRPNIIHHLENQFFANLPFELTNGQKRIIDEIEGDLKAEKRSLRLIQGDVGSGKTVLAAYAAVKMLECGKQICVIAPTTVLANQHFQYFSKMLGGFVSKISLLTSATTKKQKEKIAQELADGTIKIIIATHAIIEDYVKFQDLGLAIIDEQHRFGVLQRLAIMQKGKDIDLLLMSATPIPRSLMMTIHGDIDISILSEKPKNRQEITTIVRSNKKNHELYESISKVLQKGEKIYWVCPAIEHQEDEALNEAQLVSVDEKFAELSQIFGTESLLLLHGKMSENEKDKILKEFTFGSPKILIATTVIEVGIDVGDATIIAIENAENFGLAQLHQLRGRVGRSDKKSFCILLYGKKISANGRKRLEILKNSSDGFFIAEEDLKMRGAGEIVGTKQSGIPEFIIADLEFDLDLLKVASKDCQAHLSKDPKIENSPHRNLIEAFGYKPYLELASYTILT